MLRDVIHPQEERGNFITLSELDDFLKRKVLDLLEKRKTIREGYDYSLKLGDQYYCDLAMLDESDKPAARLRIKEVQLKAAKAYTRITQRGIQTEIAEQHVKYLSSELDKLKSEIAKSVVVQKAVITTSYEDLQNEEAESPSAASDPVIDSSEESSKSSSHKKDSSKLREARSSKNIIFSKMFGRNIRVQVTTLNIQTLRNRSQAQSTSTQPAAHVNSAPAETQSSSRFGAGICSALSTLGSSIFSCRKPSASTAKQQSARAAIQYKR